MKLICSLLPIVLACVLLAKPVVLRAQDAGNGSADINAKFQDALNQLKAAQDRKNELAGENEKLKARIADLEKQQEELNRQHAEIAESTWRLRMENSAWRGFIARHPQALAAWKIFLDRDPLAAPTTLPSRMESITQPLQSD